MVITQLKYADAICGFTLILGQTGASCHREVVRSCNLSNSNILC